MAADKNCIPINMHESRFSKITELIISNNISRLATNNVLSQTSLSKGFSKRGTAKLLDFLLLRLSLQIPVLQRLDREEACRFTLESTYKVLGRKITLFVCPY